MGIYLNPGKVAYEKAVNTEIFVDKTKMLLFLNSVVKTKKGYISVSRPRRFGKTMAADMITAYYGRGGDRPFFEKLKLSESDGWDKYLGGFNVIRLVMTDFFKEGMDVDSSLQKLQKKEVRDLKKQYPDVDYFDTDDLIS